MQLNHIKNIIGLIGIYTVMYSCNNEMKLVNTKNSGIKHQFCDEICDGDCGGIYTPGKNENENYRRLYIRCKDKRVMTNRMFDTKRKCNDIDVYFGWECDKNKYSKLFKCLGIYKSSYHAKKDWINEYDVIVIDGRNTKLLKLNESHGLIMSNLAILESRKLKIANNEIEKKTNGELEMRDYTDTDRIQEIQY
jgi:hypothetical protein